MYIRLFIIFLISTILACEKSETDLHEVDAPLRPIELRTGRDVQIDERLAAVPAIADSRELVSYLVPRLVVIMAQAELAETAYNRPSRVNWLRELRVDYRQRFNTLNQLGRQYSYPVNASLSVAMQRQVNAMQSLSDSEFRRQYPELLRAQLEQMSEKLSNVGPGLHTEFTNLRRDLVQIINAHLDGLRQEF
ncbi:MAG: hypothetical protein AAGF87_10575 [Bacteroidota bacterium]